MPGKVFTMKTNETANIEPADPEIIESKEQRFQKAAAPCPEEYRAAYIHLLEQIQADSMDIIKENGPDCPSPYEDFCMTVINFIVNNPGVDPWQVAEIVDHYPHGAELAEQLRMLSRLRQRERV